MSRSMASDVSALSGIVANSHQTVHFVSPAPSEIPYGGFSPVRLQAGCQKRPSPLHSGFDVSTVAVSSGRVLFRSRTCVRRHARLLTPHTCPVALGSSSGYVVRQPHRLLWPHPSFCRPLRVSSLLLAALGLQKVPNLFCQSLIPCRRPYSGGSGAPTTSLHTRLGLHLSCRGSATTMLHTPDYVWPH
jgi:hypothetical protein